MPLAAGVLAILVFPVVVNAVETGQMRRKRMEAWARLKDLLESRPDA